MQVGLKDKTFEARSSSISIPWPCKNKLFDRSVMYFSQRASEKEILPVFDYLLNY